jgi:hypothetical protein
MEGTAWVASYVVLWVLVVVLALAVVALLRQIGVLHTRLRPLGVHFAGEGPALDEPAPPGAPVDYAAARLTVLAFTSPACELCAALLPSLRALDRQYGDLRVVVLDHGPATAPAFRAFNVSSTPYLVAVDRLGVVRARGVANSLEQAEVMVEESLGRAA